MTRMKISVKEAEFLVVLTVITFIITFCGNWYDQMELQKNIIKSVLNAVGAIGFGIVYYLFRNIK